MTFARGLITIRRKRLEDIENLLARIAKVGTHCASAEMELLNKCKDQSEMSVAERDKYRTDIRQKISDEIDVSMESYHNLFVVGGGNVDSAVLKIIELISNELIAYDRLRRDFVSRNIIDIDKELDRIVSFRLNLERMRGNILKIIDDAIFA